VLALVATGAFLFFAVSLVPRSPATVARSHHSSDDRGHGKDCEAEDFTKTTLKLVDESTIMKAVPGDGIRKFEASDVTGMGWDSVLVVFDNSFRIAKVGSYAAQATENTLLTWPGDVGEDSQFEGITYNTSSDSFLVVQEEIEGEDGQRRAIIFDVKIVGDAVQVLDQCTSEWTFVKENKGFEGAAVYTTTNGESLLLGLCEGNHCAGGKEGRDTGHGVIVAMEKAIDKQGVCTFVTKSKVKVPSSANFVDYSAITIYNNSRVAISSQENSAVWIGDISTSDSGEVEFSTGKVYDFPRNDQCDMIYCNIEGVYFEEPHKLVAVSDKMKKGGKQNFKCATKDQSIHTFALP